jgi:hypothetical protein
MHRSERAAAYDHRMTPRQPLLSFFTDAGEENLAGISFGIHQRIVDCGLQDLATELTETTEGKREATALRGLSMPYLSFFPSLCSLCSLWLNPAFISGLS